MKLEPSRIALTLLALVVSSAAARAAHHEPLREELSPLAFLVGHCWAGEFPDNGGTDIHCFSAMFGGMHIRDTHVLLGGPGPYQGETVYSWNGVTKEIAYVYWNSIGGVSLGSAVPESGTIAFPDETYEGSDGQTVTVSTRWRLAGEDAYDSVVVESYPDGSTAERKVRYHKRPFADDPAEAKSFSDP